MTRPADGDIKLSLKWIATVSLLVAISSLATLAVVSGVRGADALSTIALALAVLAFVVQIMVYIVQAGETARQSERSQELHGQLMSVVAHIEERTQGTQQSVERMNFRLLEAVLGKAVNEGRDVSDPSFVRALAKRINTNPTSTVSARSSETLDLSEIESSDDLWPKALPPEEASAIRSEMLEWPMPDEAQEIIDIMESLSDRDKTWLWRLARDLVSSTRKGASIGPGVGLPRTSNLTQAGLAEKIPGWKLFTLSPRGRRVARVLIAKGDPPEGLTNLRELRAQVAELIEKDKVERQNSRRD